MGKRAVLIVLDSVGIGEAPDADQYGDIGSATLQHTASSVGGLSLPNFQSMGLGNIPPLLPATDAIQGVHSTKTPTAKFGAMQEVSQGKDTITGHWEIAGIELNPGFHLFPPVDSFPPEILHAFVEQTGRPIIGNKAASGTVVLEELGQQSIEQGAFILYTSADSVMQIAAHTDVVPLEELYAACEIGRKLCDPYRVGRVIARPFRGTDGQFTRTSDRKDYAFQTEEPTILEKLSGAGVPVYAVGKIEDIYAFRGIDFSSHTANNLESQQQVLEYLDECDHGFIFANFIDFDMLYGHRRDPQGYARSLEQTDTYITELLNKLTEDDLLIITADHGNDPTFRGTDHTREYVPLLVWQKEQSGASIGLRHGFYDIAQSLADYFKIGSYPRGKSFL